MKAKRIKRRKPYWRQCADELPDADMTVLIVDPDEGEITLGFLDGDVWRDIHGATVEGMKEWMDLDDLPAAGSMRPRITITKPKKEKTTP